MHTHWTDMTSVSKPARHDKIQLLSLDFLVRYILKHPHAYINQKQKKMKSFSACELRRFDVMRKECRTRITYVVIITQWNISKSVVIISNITIYHWRSAESIQTTGRFQVFVVRNGLKDTVTVSSSLAFKETPNAFKYRAHQSSVHACVKP